MTDQLPQSNQSDVTENGSESENPAIPSPTPKTSRPRTNQDWWPNQLDLRSCTSTHRGATRWATDFDYAKAFAALDVEALKQDVIEVMTTSQDWWPADYGHYGPLFIRMSWHAAGTYRIEDGRGGGGDGAQRFAPLNSWPDNANLDKARRLLWPIKQKYGRSRLLGRPAGLRRQRRLRVHGLQDVRLRLRPRGRLGARGDLLGPGGHLARRRALQRRPRARRPSRRRADGPHLRQPRGPQRQPRPARRRARHPRDLPPDGDERRGDRRADRRRPHVRQDPRRGVGGRPRRPRARGGSVHEQGLGWKSTYGTGKGKDTITSGLEGAWTPTPTKWGNDFFENLFGHEWELTESPAGAKQWVAKDAEARPCPTRTTRRRSTARPC